MRNEEEEGGRRKEEFPNRVKVDVMIRSVRIFMSSFPPGLSYSL
jgi:hypothetical protein